MNWMTSAACIALLGTLAACETTPAPTVETAPVADAAETVSKDAPKTGLSNIQVIETSDGYSAWLVTEPSIPIISINMAWKGGETSDPIGKEGATSLMTYMMNEGGGDLDSKAYATRMEELNMSFGCSTGNDWTSCSMSTLSENLEPAMELVRLGLIETRFDEAPYTRAVEETLVSLKQSETSAGTIARKALYEAIYPDHPYAKYGTEESVLAISIDDLIAQRDAIMTKDTLLVTAVGDVSPDRLKSVMEMTFADLPEESQVQPLDECATVDVRTSRDNRLNGPRVGVVSRRRELCPQRESINRRHWTVPFVRTTVRVRFRAGGQRRSRRRVFRYSSLVQRRLGGGS